MVITFGGGCPQSETIKQGPHYRICDFLSPYLDKKGNLAYNKPASRLAFLGPHCYCGQGFVLLPSVYFQKEAHR